MANDADARHEDKPSRGRPDATKKKVEGEKGPLSHGRPDATEKKVKGEGDPSATLDQITRLIRTGKLKVTAEEMKKLRKLRGEIERTNRAYNLHRPSKRARQAQRSNKVERFVIDSGATITLLRSKSWLKRLLTRVRAVVKTATGESARTRAHGPLQIWSRNRKGESVNLGRIGEGHLLRDLAFPLLSVSQLCKHGCTVVFKPKDAYMITAANEVIPFEQERGLYFLPEDRRSKAVKDANAHVPVSPEEFHATLIESDPKILSKGRKTMRVLKRAGYHHQIAGALKLRGDALLWSVEAQYERAKLDHLNGRMKL